MADYNINAITRRVVFTGSAGVGPYAFSFEVLDENDVAVYFNTTLLTLTTDYTVTVNANGTGSVTIVTGTNVPSTPTASDTIIIIGARDIERVTDFVTAGDLLASSLNEQLDALTIFDQQLAEEGQRSMRAPVYDPALVADGGTLDMTLPSASERAGKNLAFDANGNPEAGEDIGTFRGNWAASTTYYKRDIVKDASNDNIYRVNTEHTSSGTTPISGNADAAKFDLIIDAEAAYNYASDAEKLAINPEDSQFTLSDGVTTGYSALHHKEKALDAQTAAEAAQAAAETAETNAATSETNAATSATNASNAQTAAETALDTFDDTYLGAKATNPTVDNDGDPLAAGMLYTNTTDGNLYWYDGAGWNDVTAGAGGLNDVVDDTSPQLGGTLDVNNQLVQFADSTGATDNRLQLGTGQDMQLYHDGTTNKIDTSATQELHVNSDDVLFYDNSGTTRTAIVSPGSTMNFQLYDSTGTVRVFAVNGSGNEFHRSVYIQDQRSLGFKEDIANGTNYVAFQAPAAIAANVTWTLPDADGTSGQSIVTDGAGVLSWGSGGGGSFLGDSGGGLADIIRVHEEQLDTDVTVAANTNGLCAGPLTVATGVTVTVNGNLVIA